MKIILGSNKKLNKHCKSAKSQVFLKSIWILYQTLEIEAITRTHHSFGLLHFLSHLLRGALRESYAFSLEMMNGVLDLIFQYVNHLKNVFLFNVVTSFKKELGLVIK